jgi:hypothetical protein
VLYSGHDNTLLPLLNSLRVFDEKHPPMGSYLALELYAAPKQSDGERLVRVVYNDQEKKLPECRQYEVSVYTVEVGEFTAFRYMACVHTASLLKYCASSFPQIMKLNVASNKQTFDLFAEMTSFSLNFMVGPFRVYSLY